MGKQIREQYTKVQKQKERALRDLKRAEIQFRHVKDELSGANTTIEKLQYRVSFDLIPKTSKFVVFL
jgi:predicted  nucleic acid-binding Zn-ribbon protein